MDKDRSPEEPPLSADTLYHTAYSMKDFPHEVSQILKYLALYSCTLDCIRFAKFRNDSSDTSDLTMKKTPQVRHVFHSRKSEEYTLDLDRSYSLCFFRSRVTPRVTRITRVVVNLCESNTIQNIMMLLSYIYIWYINPLCIKFPIYKILNQSCFIIQVLSDLKAKKTEKQ